MKTECYLPFSLCSIIKFVKVDCLEHCAIQRRENALAPLSA